MINYHNKKFQILSNSQNGDLESGFVFHYTQVDNLLKCHYKSKSIKEGYILGLVAEDGSINMVYHQVDGAGVLCSGKCRSVPEVLSDGRIKLHETWEWTSGKQGSGSSELIEVV